MTNSKKIIGLIVLFYIVTALWGIVANRIFDINDYNGSWSGTRSTQFMGKGSHTQYHFLNINEGEFQHSVQDPRNGERIFISSGKIEKTLMKQLLPGFQKDVNFEIVSIERNNDNSIYSFCVIRKGGKIDDCDIRFRK